MLPPDSRSVEFQPAYALLQGLEAGSPGRVFGFIGADLLVTPEGWLPEIGDFACLGAPRERLLIGHMGGRCVEMCCWPSGTPFPDGLRRGHLRTLWGKVSEAELAAANRAIQLAGWLSAHRYCGSCGHEMQTRPKEPARSCPACGSQAFPRISPVAIVLVVKGRELLLARSPHFQPGVYSALAGFVEAGETIEDCARREVREEAGLEISNLRWFGSQAWPYPHSLMLGFVADYAGGELRLQTEELEDGGWFHKDALPLLPHPETIAARMIRAVRGGCF